MMCPIFYKSFCGAFFKKRLIASPRPYYLLASSIATATATVILSLGVVTCADESHQPFLQEDLRPSRDVQTISCSSPFYKIYTQSAALCIMRTVRYVTRCYIVCHFVGTPLT